MGQSPSTLKGFSNGSNIYIGGLHGAGKTTILYRIVNKPPHPSAHISKTIKESLKRDRSHVTLIEVNVHPPNGGKKWTEQLVRGYALIWVVDAHDEAKVAESRGQLLLAMKRLGQVPLLIFANKIDLISSTDLGLVSQRLKIEDYKSVVEDFQPCCGTNGVGVEDGVACLESRLRAMYPQAR